MCRCKIDDCPLVFINRYWRNGKGKAFGLISNFPERFLGTFDPVS